jgi:outer membrane lipoprotein-sorting protein
MALSGMVLLKGQSPEVLKAKKILDKVSATTRSYNSISANFVFTLENTQENISDSHKGAILIAGDKYKVTLMNVDTYFNGTTIWTYLKEVGEVNISEPDPMDEETLNPANIFSIYEKGFRYIFAGETQLDGKTVEVVDLFPENRDKPYSRIKLFVAKESGNIAKITQLGKDGNNYIIDIKDLKPNVTCNDSMFVFKTESYPDVDVIDLR